MSNTNPFLQSPINEIAEAQNEAALGLPAQPKVDTRQPATSTADNLLPAADVRPLFEAYAAKYDVPVNVLMALGHQESRYNPTAIGPKTEWGRAKGMMQYLDETAKGMGINPFDPDQSIGAAAKQIRERLDKGYSMEDAVKEHFAGPDRKKWGSKTDAYGREVMEKVGKIGALFGASSGGDVASTPASGRDMTQMQRLLDEEEPGRFRVMTDEDVTAFNAKKAKDDEEAQAAADARPWTDRMGEGLTRGMDNTVQSLTTARYVMGGGGDSTALADAMSKKMLSEMARPKTTGEKKIDDAFQEVTDAKGVVDTTVKGAKAIGTAFTNPKDLSVGIAEQAANMLPSLAGGAAGAAGGAAAGGVVGAAPGAVAGAIWGGRAGMVAGTTATELGAEAEYMVTERLKAAGLPPTPENIKSILDDKSFISEAQSQGLKKGLTVAVVDQLFMKLGGSVATAPGRKAAATGVPASAGSRMAAGGAAVGIDAVGETVGEGLGQKVARGEVDYGDALREGVYGLGQSIVEPAVGAAMETGKAGAKAASGGVQGELGREMMRTAESLQTNPVAIDAEARQAFNPDNAQMVVEKDGNVEIRYAAPSQAPGPLTRAAENATEPVTSARVTVRAPEGNISGFMESYQEDAQGNFTARVLGDDGQPYTFTSQDGVTIEKESGPLTKAVEQVVASEPVAEPAAPPVEQKLVEDPAPPPAAPAPVAIADMDEAELRERLKYLAQQAKISGSTKMIVAERRKVEAAINKLTSEAKNVAPDNANDLLVRDDRTGRDQGVATVGKDQPATVAGVEANRESGKPGSGKPVSADGTGLSGANAAADQQPALAKDLAGVKPRYAYGQKQFDLTFSSDIDRAAYIAAQKNPSKRDADYVRFVSESTGMTDAQVREHGNKVRDSIKEMAKDADPGSLSVPTIYSRETKATVDPAAGKWFGSQEKADAYVAKKGLSGTHQVVQTGKVRFEVKPKEQANGSDQRTDKQPNGAKEVRGEKASGQEGGDAQANQTEKLTGEQNGAQATEAVKAEAKGPQAPAAAVKSNLPAPAAAGKLSVEFDGKRYPVDSYEDASHKWAQFRDSTGAGASDIGNGVPIFDASGKQIANVSYNGRVWEGTTQDKPVGASGKQSAKDASATGEKLENGTAPEHVQTGVDDRELAQIVQEFNDAQARMVSDGERITHVFDEPEKSEIVRLEDKTRVYHKDHGWMTVQEAKEQIAKWKEHAQKQGETNANSDKIVLSLFDLTGSWSNPWAEAGYQVYRFDIQDDAIMGDVNNFSTEFFNEWFGSFEGQDIYAILAACPCTDFASSGARHFAAKDEDGRTIASVKLVHQALATIEYFKPAVWAIENPVGRIERLTGLPPWRLSFNPNHLGDPYTKKTLLWGRFNADLPIAPVEPTEGSKMHKLYGGKSLATKNARSETPEGFSYGFFMANNAIDNPVMAVANKYDRLDRDLIGQALDAGITEQEISDLVDDPYYFSLDDAEAEDALRNAIDERTPPPTKNADTLADNPETELNGDAIEKEYEAAKAAWQQSHSADVGERLKAANEARNEKWWKDLTPWARRDALKNAGLDLPDRVLWTHISEGNKRKLELVRRDADEAAPKLDHDKAMEKLAADFAEQDRQEGRPPARTAGIYTRWRDSTPAQRRELLAKAGYTDADQARALSGADWNQLTDPVRRALDAEQKQAAPAATTKDADQFAGNKIFTADKVAAARARMKSKFGQLNSGIDPEMMIDGMTVAGAYIESGVREFSAYAKAMIADFGEGVKPYLLSFYEGARNYPGLKTEGMSSVDEAKSLHAEMLIPADVQTEAVGELVKKPATRTKKTGAKSDITLTQDWGVEHIDGYSDDYNRETGSTVKDAFLKEARSYLTAVAGALVERGYTPYTDSKGRPEKMVSVNESGIAGSGDISMTLAGPDGVGAYVHISDSSLRGVVPTTPSGIAIMFRAAKEGDKYGGKGQNRWAPVDLSAADLAAMVDKEVKAQVAKPAQKPTINAQESENDTEPSRQDAGTGPQGQPAEGVRTDEGGRNTDAVSEPAGRADRGTEGDGVRATRKRPAVPENRGSDAKGAGSQQPDQGGGGRGAATGDRGSASPGSLNYRVKPGELKREGSWRQTAERNVEIVELIKRLDAEGRQPTEEERAAMVKFTGWGASEIANGIFPDRYGRFKDNYWQGLGERLKSALTPEEYDQAKRTTQYAHYTSEGVIRSIYAGLDRLGFKGGNVMEPGMGTGLFNGLMPDGMAANTNYTGIEYDTLTGKIAKALYPESNVIIGDFTRTNMPKNFFDAAIGNPPFSQTQVLNDPEYKSKRPMLHDYFFMKTIDRVKPGGLLVFVTSKGTMDKTSDKSRKYLADQANLLGAIRLPQTAFKDNAGTEVVTDVIFLQKRGEGIPDNGVQWLGTQEVQTPQGPAAINEYFAAHPEMVLGSHALTGSMYRANEYTVIPQEGVDIETAFAKAVENLPENVSRTVRGSKAERAVVQDRDFNPKHKKEGGLYLSDAGKLMQVEDGTGIELNFRKGSDGKQIALNPKQKKWLRDYVGVRDALKQTQYDQLNDGNWEKSLKALNKAYDAFTKEHGRILDYTTIERTDDEGKTTETKRFKNQALFQSDVEGALVFALEVIREDGTIEKGVALKERVLEKAREPEIKTTQDALFVSLNRNGTLDIDDVARLAGTDRASVLNDLGTSVYEAPGADWQLADEYLSGNVVRKLKEAQAAASINDKYKRNVDALLAVQPNPLGPTDITVRLGTNWVPPSDVAQFGSEVLGDRMDVTYNPLVGAWKVTPRTSNVSEWGFARMSSGEILEDVLNSRQIKLTVRDSDGKTYPDVVNTEKANDIAAKMRERFRTWVWTDPIRADRLVNYYNENFNNIAPRKFDGSHLTLPGVSSRFKLYPHQKRAVWRVVQQGDTYLAHAVGAGKTMEMIAAGMEERRLGLSNKPMYVVPNHMLAQFSREFLELYPAANIMVADEHNFGATNRKRFVAQAALNNPDAIVITHSAFGRISMSEEFSSKFINDQIETWKETLEDIDPSDRVTTKQIERRIEQLERRLEGKQAKERKDNVLTFEELGVDRLFVDEFHEFRKLDYATNQGSVKGISPDGSQRALDLSMKVQYLRSKKPGRSLVAASGTPVTNTMGELFTAQRFFRPDQLKEDGTDTFDAWSAQYGDIVTGFEQNAAGGYEMVNRFAKFQNVPELMRRVRSFMDILTSNNLGELVKRPDVIGGGREVIVTPSPDGYKEYQQQLQSRIQSIRARRGPPKKGDDIILSVISDGRFSAIDLRFVDPTLPSDPNSKLNIWIDDIIKAYKETADNEFVDKMTGKRDPIKGASIIGFSDIGLGEASAANRGFDMRAWIENRLTEAGIPSDHIAFMRDHKQHAKKERLFADMREGKKRILIGGKEMETGTNVQKRLKHLLHLDAPWYPASVEQREGRIVRQGNQNEQVKITAYATKGSYDSTMWGMNARKARFIEQAMNGDDSVRSLDDVSEASAFEMAAALASGDERYLKMAGLKTDVDRLERLRQAHFQDQNVLRREKHYAESLVESTEKLLKQYNDAIAKRTPIKAGEFSAKAGKTMYDNREEFSSALFNASKDLGTEMFIGEKKLGEIGGFDIIYYGMELKGGNYAGSVHVDIPGDPEPLMHYPIDPNMPVSGMATRAANQVNGLDREVANSKTKIEDAKRKIEQIGKRLGAAFPEEAILLEKVADLNSLDAELAAEGEDANAEAAAATQEIEGKPEDGEQADDGVRYSVADGANAPATFREDIGTSKNWLANKFAEVEEDGRDRFGVPKSMGSITGWFNRPLDLPTYLLGSLRGERGEQDNVRQDSLDYIRKHWDEVKKEPVYVEVDPYGQAWVSEGNHRIMVARELGESSLPVEVRYFTGGQTKAGPWAPEELLSLDREKPNQDIRYSVADGVTQAEFGPVYTGIDAGEAIARLTKDEAGEAIVPVPGLGDVSIVYGDRNAGLQHIAARRGEDMLNRIPGLLKDGSIYTKEGQTGRVFIGTDRDEAALRLDWNVAAKTWLLSAYEKYPNLNDARNAVQSRREEVVRERTQQVMTVPQLRQALSKGVIGSVLSAMTDSGVLVLHNTGKTLPKGTRKARGVQALTMPNGTIHMVANAVTAQNAQAVLLHEAFHNGGERLIGTQQWAKMMGRMGSLYRQSEQSTGKAREFFDKARARVAAAKKQGAVATRMEVEEFAAYAIEEYESAPAAIRKWVDDLIGLVKAWVQKRFGKQIGQVTPAQLSAIAKMVIMDIAADRRGEIFGPIGTLFSATEQTKTPAFKRWFGDSKVVDTEGNPLVLYHGTRGDFSIFDNEKVGERFPISKGFYATTSQERASIYADSVQNAAEGWRYDSRFARPVEMGANVMPVYVSIQNPKIVEGKFIASEDVLDANMGKLVRDAKAAGHDGVIVRNIRGDEYSETTVVAFRPEQIKSATGNNGDFDPTNPDIRYSVSPEKADAAIDAADKALDAAPVKDDYIGRVAGDIGLSDRLIVHPRQVAAIHPEFTPVYRTAISQMETRDKHIAELGKDVAAYDSLPQDGKERVNKVLELGRLMSTTYSASALQSGITNTGERAVVSIVDGKPVRAVVPVKALLSGSGEVIKLSSEEAQAYSDLRTMFDRALDMMRDQTLDELGFGQFAGQPNAAKAILDTAKGLPDEAAERIKNVASFVSEIEQAKRAGYVPFARYGDYVVTVKEKVANAKYIEDSTDKLIVQGLPDSFADSMLDIGAEQTPEGWRIDKGQRRDVERLTEKTIYSAKVETGIKDFLAERGAKTVEDIPVVKEAIDKARREHVWNNPARRIVAFKIDAKKPDAAVRMSDVDALAEVANLDNATWDMVREKLSDAIKAKGFRRHFFHSDNVPGYTGDFERSISDYVIGMSGYLSRREHMKQWDRSVSSIKNKPKLHSYASKYQTYVNSPQEELAMVRQIGFFSYIAGVAASAFANLTQVPFLTLPTLSQVAPSALVVKEIARAYKDALAMMNVASFKSLHMFDPNKAPADVRASIKAAWDEGVFVPLESFDLMMTARQRNIGRRKLVRGFNKTSQAVAIAFTFAERLNRLVTFIAASRLAEKRAVQMNANKVLANDSLASAEILGRNWSPRSFAEWAVDESQFRMGKANRPEAMRGVGSAIMQFKGFMLQTFEAWYRMAALHGGPGKYAAAASIMTLAAFAGVWGLPGADDLRKLLEAIYKQITDTDLDLKTELRGWIARTSGSNAIAQIASKGVTYPTGLDLTRVGLGSVVPDSPLAAAGIPFDMLIGRPKRAFQKGSSGDYMGAAGEMTPNFIKHWLVAGGWAMDGVRDNRGNLILTKDELSNADLVMKSLGFQPSIVSDVRDYEYAQRRAETAVDGLKRSYTAKLARTIAAMEGVTDKEKLRALDQKVTEIYADIDKHNEKASPEQIIKIGNVALRNRIMRELDGVKSTWGRERKNARGSAIDMRQTFGLSQEDD